MLIVIIPYFTLLVLKQVNVVVTVIILTIRMQNVPDVIKDLNIKVFNLMSRTNETRFIESHETYK